MCTGLTVVVSSGLCPEIICVCTCVCKLCFVCMCGSVLLHLINTKFRVNNYFMNLFLFEETAFRLRTEPWIVVKHITGIHIL